MRLAGALSRFWEMHGHLSEGRAWLEGLLRPEPASGGAGALAIARAKALTGAGALAHRQGDYARATALLEEALALRRELGDTGGIAASLNHLGIVAEHHGDYGQATALHEEALALGRTIGNKLLAAYGLEGLAGVAGAQRQPQRAARLWGRPRPRAA